MTTNVHNDPAINMFKLAAGVVQDESDLEYPLLHPQHFIQLLEHHRIEIPGIPASGDGPVYSTDVHKNCLHEKAIELYRKAQESVQSDRRLVEIYHCAGLLMQRMNDSLQVFEQSAETLTKRLLREIDAHGLVVTDKSNLGRMYVPKLSSKSTQLEYLTSDEQRLYHEISESPHLSGIPGLAFPVKFSTNRLPYPSRNRMYEMVMLTFDYLHLCLTEIQNRVQRRPNFNIMEAYNMYPEIVNDQTTIAALIGDVNSYQMTPIQQRYVDSIGELVDRLRKEKYSRAIGTGVHNPMLNIVRIARENKPGSPLHWASPFQRTAANKIRPFLQKSYIDILTVLTHERAANAISCATILDRMSVCAQHAGTVSVAPTLEDILSFYLEIALGKSKFDVLNKGVIDMLMSSLLTHGHVKTCGKLISVLSGPNLSKRIYHFRTNYYTFNAINVVNLLRDVRESTSPEEHARKHDEDFTVEKMPVNSPNKRSSTKQPATFDNDVDVDVSTATTAAPIPGKRKKSATGTSPLENQEQHRAADGIRHATIHLGPAYILQYWRQSATAYNPYVANQQCPAFEQRNILYDPDQSFSYTVQFLKYMCRIVFNGNVPADLSDAERVLQEGKGGVCRLNPDNLDTYSPHYHKAVDTVIDAYVKSAEQQHTMNQSIKFLGQTFAQLADTPNNASRCRDLLASPDLLDFFIAFNYDNTNSQQTLDNECRFLRSKHRWESSLNNGTEVTEIVARCRRISVWLKMLYEYGLTCMPSIVPVTEKANLDKVTTPAAPKSSFSNYSRIRITNELELNLRIVATAKMEGINQHLLPLLETNTAMAYFDMFLTIRAMHNGKTHPIVSRSTKTARGVPGTGKTMMAQLSFARVLAIANRYSKTNPNQRYVCIYTSESQSLTQVFSEELVERFKVAALPVPVVNQPILVDTVAHVFIGNAAQVRDQLSQYRNMLTDARKQLVDTTIYCMFVDEYSAFDSIAMNVSHELKLLTDPLMNIVTISGATIPSESYFEQLHDKNKIISIAESFDDVNIPFGCTLTDYTGKVQHFLPKFDFAYAGMCTNLLIRRYACMNLARMRGCIPNAFDGQTVSSAILDGVLEDEYRLVTPGRRVPNPRKMHYYQGHYMPSTNYVRRLDLNASTDNVVVFDFANVSFNQCYDRSKLTLPRQNDISAPLSDQPRSSSVLAMACYLSEESSYSPVEMYLIGRKMSIREKIIATIKLTKYYHSGHTTEKEVKKTETAFLSDVRKTFTDLGKREFGKLPFNGMALAHVHDLLDAFIPTFSALYNKCHADSTLYYQRRDKKGNSRFKIGDLSSAKVAKVTHLRNEMLELRRKLHEVLIENSSTDFYDDRSKYPDPMPLINFGVGFAEWAHVVVEVSGGDDFMGQSFDVTTGTAIYPYLRELIKNLITSLNVLYQWYQRGLIGLAITIEKKNVSFEEATRAILPTILKPDSPVLVTAHNLLRCAMYDESEEDYDRVFTEFYKTVPNRAKVDPVDPVNPVNPVDPVDPVVTQVEVDPVNGVDFVATMPRYLRLAINVQLRTITSVCLYYIPNDEFAIVPIQLQGYIGLHDTKSPIVLLRKTDSYGLNITGANRMVFSPETLLEVKLEDIHQASSRVGRRYNSSNSVVYAHPILSARSALEYVYGDTNPYVEICGHLQPSTSTSENMTKLSNFAPETSFDDQCDVLARYLVSGPKCDYRSEIVEIFIRELVSLARENFATSMYVSVTYPVDSIVYQLCAIMAMVHSSVLQSIRLDRDVYVPLQIA